MQVTHRRVRGVRAQLHLVEAGRGPAVVFLHGFPESWYSWRRQLHLFSQRYRVIAVDLPGFNDSEGLGDSDGYRPDVLSDEFAGLLRKVGPAAVVGHDWGGMLAWWLAQRHADLVARLIVINCPLPVLVDRVSWRDPPQRLRSWYVAVFRLPTLGVHLARLGLPLALRLIVQPHEERRVYRESLRRSGLREPLEYYRHLARAGENYPCEPILPPALLIWGERDPFLSTRLVIETQRLVPSLRVRRVARGGHWVHQRRPDVVNETICRFLRETGYV